MLNDCYRFTATMVVEPCGDRHQSYAYTLVLSYIMWSVTRHRWQLSYVTVGTAWHSLDRHRVEMAAAPWASYILTIEKELDINALKEPQNNKSYAYAHCV